jgi:hypothetical protein
MQQSKKRVLAGAVIYALLASLSNAGAADAGVCSVVAKPANFDHQTVTLQGTVTRRMRALGCSKAGLRRWTKVLN